MYSLTKKGTVWLKDCLKSLSLKKDTGGPTSYFKVQEFELVEVSIHPIDQTTLFLTDREVFLLRKMLEFDITRYLLVNMTGRYDGWERAERHKKICETICKFLLCRSEQLPVYKVHEYSTKLTSFMDEKIELPIDRVFDSIECEVLAERFFNEVIKMLPEIYNLIKNDSTISNS